MEEDIKILEERVIMLKRHIKNYEESDCKTNVYQQLIKECQAIETLIKEYKNLQQIEQEHKKENGALREIIKELEQNQCTHNIDNGCIRKSKVQEKIEELKRQEKEELKGMKGQDRYFVKQMYQYKIQVLEELLKEEK